MECAVLHNVSFELSREQQEMREWGIRDLWRSPQNRGKGTAVSKMNVLGMSEQESQSTRDMSNGRVGGDGMSEVAGRDFYLKWSEKSLEGFTLE